MRYGRELSFHLDTYLKSPDLGMSSSHPAALCDGNKSRSQEEPGKPWGAEHGGKTDLNAQCELKRVPEQN